MSQGLLRSNPPFRKIQQVCVSLKSHTNFSKKKLRARDQFKRKGEG